jgi:hypothetical protein
MSANVQLLAESDLHYLDSKGFRYQVSAHGSEIHLVIKDFELPEHYSPRKCDLLLRLPAGYPNTNPDMFWTTLGIRLASGGPPVAAEVIETLDGTQWQRWSRHNNAWRPGVDDIQTKLRAVRTELDRGR